MIERNSGVRDALVVLLFATLGAALVVTTVLRLWPLHLLPPDTHRPDYLYNLRLWKLMLLLEGCGLLVLAALAASRGVWLRQLGGVAVIEKHARVALGIVLFFHGAGILFFLPPQQILSPEPVHNGWHPTYFYRVFAAQQLLERSGTTWGYDPFVEAGTAGGLFREPDTGGDALFAAVATSVLGLPYVSKAYMLLVQMLVPIAVFAAARLLGLRRDSAFWAALAAAAYWAWGRPFLGAVRLAGMHSYQLTCLLGLVAAAAAVRFYDPDHRVRIRSYALAVGLAVLAGYVHPGGILQLLPVFAIAFATGMRRLRRRDHVALWLATALVLFLLWTAWRELLRNPGLVEVAAGETGLHGPGDLLRVLLRPTSALATAVLVLGALGLWIWRRHAGLAAATLAGWVMVLGGVAAFGSRLPVFERVEPFRLVLPMVLACSLPAGDALRHVADFVQRIFGRPLALLATLVAITCLPFLAMLDARFFYVTRLDATLDPRFLELLEQVQATSSDEGRLLFESMQDLRNSFSPGAPLQALVPIYTRRELVGAPRQRFDARPGLDLGAGRLAGRPFASWSGAELAAFLERYAVTTVVAWSQEARGFLAAHADLLPPTAEVHGFQVYRRRVHASRVEVGRAQVRADYNRIEISEIEGEELVLRYHWMPGLRASPPVPVEHVPVPDDPVGFIRVRPQGHTRIVLAVR